MIILRLILIVCTARQCYRKENAVAVVRNGSARRAALAAAAAAAVLRNACNRP